MIFDYDETLVTNGVATPLLNKLASLGIKEIKIWSNGATWMNDGILEKMGIKATHIETPDFMSAVGLDKFLEDFDYCQKEAVALKMQHNVSAVKYANLVDGVLVDDLAPLWSKVSGVKVLTPEEALELM